MRNYIIVTSLLLFGCNKAPELKRVAKPVKLLVPYATDIIRESKVNGLDPKFVAAIAHVETGGTYKPNLTSHKGARGLMQLMPRTIRKMGVLNPESARDSIRGATRWLYLGREELVQHGYEPTKFNLARWYNAGINYFKESETIGADYASLVIKQMEAL